MENNGNKTLLRYLIIYNEQAGVAFGNQRELIKKFFAEKNIGVAIHNTTPDGSFLDIDASKYERVIAVGGDGTVREVASWLIRNDYQTPLAIVPRGSGNILAHALQIPFNLTKALELSVNGPIKNIDVGQINEREYFLLAAGVGIDAMVMRHTSKKLKRIFGILAYAQGFIRAFLSLKRDKFFIKSEEFSGTLKAQSIFVSNVNKLLNFKLHPQAKFNDGLLNVAILTTIDIPSAVRIASNMLKGKYEKDDRYIYFKTKHIYISPLSKTVPMQIDGEVVRFPYLDIKILPQKLGIVTNKELT